MDESLLRSLMQTRSPLFERHEHDGARFLAWGEGDGAIPVVESFGPIDSEYAHIRKGCVLFDRPHRATVEAMGDDRIEFLGNLVTQELEGIGPLEHRSAFRLNRKGRILGDLRLCQFEDRMLIECDALDAAEVAKSLGEFVFAEDVTITDTSDQYHRLGLYGPNGPRLIELASRHTAGVDVRTLAVGRACLVEIGGARVLVERVELTGDVCLELTVPRARVGAVYDHLCTVGELPPLDPETGAYEREPTETQRVSRMRRAGWLAVNVARVEGGTPLYRIDFGSTNLPGETGLLGSRVSFTKGCYLGQEVVARMAALGAPKQRLVALRLDGADDRSALPLGGAQVYPPADGGGIAGESSGGIQPVGVVTSSTISPMLGGEPVMFAMVRTKHAGADARLRVEAEGEMHDAIVQKDLAFWVAPMGSEK